jgi:hypothetical protein
VKRTIPTTLEINGERWTVRIRSLRKLGLLGLCTHKKRLIEIDSEIPPLEQQETFLHELLHACLTEHWREDVEESMISRLSPRLITVLRSMGWAP